MFRFLTKRLQEQAAKLDEGLSAFRLEFAELTQRFQILQGSLDELTHRLSAVELGRDRLVEQVDALRGDLAPRISAVQLDHDRLVERVAALRGSHDNLEQHLLENSRIIPSEGSRDAIPHFLTRNSYSIEAEDLLVDTIFRSVIKQFRRGAYLDIGAAHPIEASNSYYFYKRGWSGICVEPNPEFYSLYQTMRPHDNVFNIGVASQTGIFRYHRFEHAYINGFYGQELVDWHVAVNHQNHLGYTEVNCQEIGEFLETNIDRPIDFLNIDIETLDAEILAAWRWDVCSPTVICTEIHTSDIRHVLESETTRILENAGYSAMCRGWLSTIFVKNEKLKELTIVGV